MRRIRAFFCVLVSLTFLSACQTELYSNLTEREANAMLGALMESGLHASKSSLGEENFSISVTTEDVQDALTILDDQGLPKRNRQSIGQVFAKSGIVSSPFEERVRYVYALGEEVAQTLQQIDGVLVARVHIVMPEEPELGQEAKPSSAAVFIKQKLGFDLDFLMPQIRRLVANSIEGVKYEEVTVVLVEAQRQSVATRDSGPEMLEPVPGLRVPPSAVPFVWGMIAAVSSLILALIAGVIFYTRRINALKDEFDDADEMEA